MVPPKGGVLALANIVTMIHDKLTFGGIFFSIFQHFWILFFVYFCFLSFICDFFEMIFHSILFILIFRRR